MMTLSIAWIVPALTLVAQQPIASPPVAEQAAIAGGQNILEEIACAPTSVDAPAVAPLHVSGGYVHGRLMFGPGEPLIVHGGSKQGVQTGQVYYVRRYVHDWFGAVSPDAEPVGVHTAGWVTIVDVKDDMAVAQVTHACDGVIDGDFLEPYADPVVPTAVPGVAPDYTNPARIFMGDDKLQTGAAGTLMLINRGTDQGVRAGQSLTIFRETLEGTGPVFDVGRGTVLLVRPKTSLIRVDASRDAVYLGDMAALHR
ncbi:MAG TPA: hypothetical protein VGI12_20755 [Vicinamibacterales bacterium]